MAEEGYNGVWIAPALMTPNPDWPPSVQDRWRKNPYGLSLCDVCGKMVDPWHEMASEKLEGGAVVAWYRGCPDAPKVDGRSFAS